MKLAFPSSRCSHSPSPSSCPSPASLHLLSQRKDAPRASQQLVAASRVLASRLVALSRDCAPMERLPIALHLPQDLLPLSGSGSSTTPRGQQPSKVVGSGAGYGPPLPADGTPLSRLVSSVLYVPPHEPTPAEAAQGWQASRGGKTEYDLVAIPLTNGNWQERWERMCTITASATEADLGVAAQQQLGPQADAQRDEAESWREGGGFLRNEVNITRSGALLALPFTRRGCTDSVHVARGVWEPHLVRVRLARARLAGRRHPLRRRAGAAARNQLRLVPLDRHHRPPAAKTRELRVPRRLCARHQRRARK